MYDVNYVAGSQCMRYNHTHVASGRVAVHAGYVLKIGVVLH
jgi:hypothetical protein